MAHHDGAERRVTILTLSLSPTSVTLGAGASPLTAQTLSQNFRAKSVLVILVHLVSMIVNLLG